MASGIVLGVFATHIPGWMPPRGYESEPCGRSRQLDCAPTASATAPFFQPRATFDVAVGKGAHVGAIGAYFGVDLYPDAAWSAGLSFSFRSQYWALAW